MTLESDDSALTFFTRVADATYLGLKLLPRLHIGEIVCLHGASGVGKTELCLHIALKTLITSSSAQVLWIVYLSVCPEQRLLSLLKKYVCDEYFASGIHTKFDRDRFEQLLAEHAKRIRIVECGPDSDSVCIWIRYARTSRNAFLKLVVIDGCMPAPHPPTEWIQTIQETLHDEKHIPCSWVVCCGQIRSREVIGTSELRAQAKQRELLFVEHASKPSASHSEVGSSRHLHMYAYIQCQHSGEQMEYRITSQGFETL